MRRKSVEDYLEVVYMLISKKGEARMREIASILRVKQPSVTEMIQKLAKAGYVEYEPYQRVKLTKKGRDIAKTVYQRHVVLTDFLKILGVHPDVAEQDACEMEHALHPETVDRLTRFVEFVKEAPRSPRWLEHFKYFYRTGKHPECKE